MKYNFQTVGKTKIQPKENLFCHCWKRDYSMVEINNGWKLDVVTIENVFVAKKKQPWVGGGSNGPNH